MKTVYCEGCAKLFHTSKDGFVPLCMNGATFRHGPLRSKIDVLGVKSAELVNKNNDCRARRRWSYKATQLKKWLLWRMNYGNKEETIREVDIDEYPIKAEIEHIRAARRKATSDEKDTCVVEEKANGNEEAVVNAGGVGDSLGTSAADSDGNESQLVFDFREHDGSEWSDVHTDDTGSFDRRETADSGVVISSS